jgi:hypothetical protein
MAGRTPLVGVCSVYPTDIRMGHWGHRVLLRYYVGMWGHRREFLYYNIVVLFVKKMIRIISFIFESAEHRTTTGVPGLTTFRLSGST